MVTGLRARWIGLARLPRPRLTPISCLKISMCSFENAGLTEISAAEMKIFPYEPCSPGNREETFLCKIAWLSHYGGQNGIMFFLYVYVFPLYKSQQRLRQSQTIQLIVAPVCFLFLEFHPGRRENVLWDSCSVGLIWEEESVVLSQFHR